jgi:hypothetical protein
VQNNNFIVLNICADAIAALLVLVGAMGLFTHQQWGRPAALIGGGMVIYATIIGLGYTLNYDPTLTAVLIVSLAIVLLCFALLWSDHAITHLRARRAESRISGI